MVTGARHPSQLRRCGRGFASSRMPPRSTLLLMSLTCHRDGLFVIDSKRLSAFSTSRSCATVVPVEVHTFRAQEQQDVDCEAHFLFRCRQCGEWGIGWPVPAQRIAHSQGLDRFRCLAGSCAASRRSRATCSCRNAGRRAVPVLSPAVSRGGAHAGFHLVRRRHLAVDRVDVHCGWGSRAGGVMGRAPRPVISAGW